MSEKKLIQTGQADRRKRINRLKKIIIGSVIGAILIPVILCVILLFRVISLEQQVHELKDQQTRQSNFVEAQAMLTDAQGADGAEQGVLIQSPAASEKTEAADEEILPPDMEEETEEHAEQPKEWDGIRRIYLTFDDGPSMETDDILNILEDYGVKATFFVVGKTDSHSVEMYQEILDRGNTLGMHSYSHKYSELYATDESFIQDLEQLQDYLYEITGEECTYYRFPGGSSNTVSHVDIQELIGILDERGITYFDWNVSCGDGGSTLLSAAQIVNNVMKDIEHYENVVVLMHDAADKSTTVEALPELIEQIQALDNVEILPITENTRLVQHVKSERGENE